MNKKAKGIFNLVSAIVAVIIAVVCYTNASEIKDSWAYHYDDEAQMKAMIYTIGMWGFGIAAVVDGIIGFVSISSSDEETTVPNGNMRLCPDCYQKVSKNAPMCPHCGRIMKENNKEQGSSGESQNSGGPWRMSDL